jgi:hypothetical protein
LRPRIWLNWRWLNAIRHVRRYTPSPLNNVITIDDERIRSRLDWVVRGAVKETLTALLSSLTSYVLKCRPAQRMF